MNIYDDLTTFLASDANIRLDSNFLFQYITTFMYRNPNREKIAEFYKNIPNILDKLLGVSLKKNQFRHFSKFLISTVDLLNSDKASFEDYDLFTHLFVPGLDSNVSMKNLFNTVTYPPDFVPDFKLNASVASKAVHELITQKKYDYVLTLWIFGEIEKKIEMQRNNLEKGNIILTIFEYFIMIILISIKEFQSKSKVNLSKYNSNFEDFHKNSSYLGKNLISEKSKELLHSLDLSKTLVYNFLLTLFNCILDFFINSKMFNAQFKLKFLISAIEFTWLSDFFLLPSSSLISKNSPEIGYSFFFKPSSNNVISNPIPNIILLDCLQTVVVTLQKGNMLFSENSYTKNSILREDSLLLRLQKPLFYFFKSCFLKYLEESASTEVNLCDVAKIWYSYITPWLQLGSSGTSMSNRGNSYDDVVREYIFMNLLFYTEIFNDYIFAFSSLNVLSKNELTLFNKILEMYKINKEGEIINDSVHLKLLEDLSLGKIYNYSFLIEVDNHVKFIGSQKKNLFPFKINENQKYAQNISNNTSTWIQKLESTSQMMNDEIINFLNTLKDSRRILKNIYGVHEDFDSMEFSSKKNFIEDSNNIYFKKNFNAIDQDSPWSRRIGSDEITVLYYLLRWIAFCMDIFRGIAPRYDRMGKRCPPVTNIRFLANYINLISILFFMVIIYSLLKLIISLM